MENSLTKTELIEVLDLYIAPIYQIIGAGVAFLLLLITVIFILKPFIRKRF